MSIRKWSVVSVICMAAFTVFSQGSANVGKSVEELKKYISLGAIVDSDYRDKGNQKFELLKATTEQDKDMGFDGVLRLTIEMTGKEGEVWYGQMSKPQGKRRPDYNGRDTWEFSISHGALKYPKIVYAVEYGYQTSNAFVAVDQQLKKVESADEIMTRNKGSKNKLKITIKARAEHDTSADVSE